ncbi:hypothetical protein [Okeania sp. SIO3B5]|uniref:hypothetical protein n=1 Tax=Okeania sp. SIO3B5 TaxID=2607811 RepID=UPI0025F576EE|nr:hypothetical protein [Okeania sp. SIO3B5]
MPPSFLRLSPVVRASPFVSIIQISLNSSAKTFLNPSAHVASIKDELVIKAITPFLASLSVAHLKKREYGS